MPDFLAAIKLLQDWITSPKTMWTFLFAVAFLLAMLAAFQHQGVAFLLEHYLILCFVFFVCMAGLIVHYAYTLVAPFQQESRIRSLIASIGDDGRSVLHNPINTRQMTFSVTPHEYVAARGLQEWGIVRMTRDQGYYGDFCIEQGVFDYLIDHPETIGIVKRA